MYTKNLKWLLLSILLPRVVIGVAIGTITSLYGNVDFIVLWGGILIKLVTVPSLRLLVHHIVLLLALHIAGLLGLLIVLHIAGLLGLLIGLLLGLLIGL